MNNGFQAFSRQSQKGKSDKCPYCGQENMDRWQETKRLNNVRVSMPGNTLCFTICHCSLCDKEWGIYSPQLKNLPPNSFQKMMHPQAGAHHLRGKTYAEMNGQSLFFFSDGKRFLAV